LRVSIRIGLGAPEGRLRVLLVSLTEQGATAQTGGATATAGVIGPAGASALAAALGRTAVESRAAKRSQEGLAFMRVFLSLDDGGVPCVLVCFTVYKIHGLLGGESSRSGCLVREGEGTRPRDRPLAFS
jgi:hypothetical protein